MLEVSNRPRDPSRPRLYVLALARCLCKALFCEHKFEICACVCVATKNVLRLSKWHRSSACCRVNSRKLDAQALMLQIVPRGGASVVRRRWVRAS